MIYIRDNGGSYSDRRIEFIEAPESVPREVVVRALETGERWSSYMPAVVAVVEKVEWYEGEPRPLADWLRDRLEYFVELDDEGVAAAAPLRAALTLVSP